MRLLADHGSDDIMEIELDGNELSIGAYSSTGMAIVDIELTVPVAGPGSSNSTPPAARSSGAMARARGSGSKARSAARPSAWRTATP